MKVNCETCNNEFKITPTRLKNKHHTCSRKCLGILSSKLHSQKIKTFCKICNKDLFYKQSHYKQISNHTCSRKCSSILRAKLYGGVKNPNYKNFTLIERFFHERVCNLKIRANAKKVEFNLSKEDLINKYEEQKHKCYYSGLELKITLKGPVQYDTLSVDRIDSLKGYTKENTVLCLNSINMLKSNHKLEDIQTVFKAIYMKQKNNIKVKCKKLFNDAKGLIKADDLAAGYDCYVHRFEETETTIKVYTGITIQPDIGYYFMLVPRSSTHKKGLIMYNNLGIIDVNYTGEIIAVFYKTNDYKSDTIKIGDRLVQLIPQEQIWVEFVESDTLSSTDRGTGGYGSTGE